MVVEPALATVKSQGGTEIAWPSTGSGWVSLRTSGEDTVGNTFSQTVFRAYRYRFG